ncbi:MAG: hypothetical protein EOP06_00310 [Proteobacteria bacterium]|nr:MAG: hypothetical protein EOP06_00310 [Pseudomonadota bacterium]
MSDMRLSHCTNPNGSLRNLESCNQFKSLALRLAQILAEEGVVVEPFRDHTLPYFNSLDIGGQAAACQSLNKYVSICESVLAEGQRLASSQTFTWRAMRELGYVPSYDLFSIIDDQDIVEFYDLKNIQVFRNLNFFRVCSYSLEDLYARPWHELFVREEQQVTNSIFEVVAELVAGKRPAVVNTKIGTQIIRETQSVRKYSLRADVHHLGLLVDRFDNPAGIAAVERAEVLRTHAARRESAALKTHPSSIDL